MTATVVTFPTVPVVRFGEAVPVTLRVSRRQYNRLVRLSKKWPMTVEEIALVAIDDYLKQKAGTS